MSETVLAALIAAGATILTTLLQLKMSLGREAGGGSSSRAASRKKPKLPALLLGVMLTAAAVGGFALSQWFAERERAQQKELRQELQARINDISRTASELRQSRTDTFAEVETDVIRRMGGSGVVALASVGPCHGQLPTVAPATADASRSPPAPSAAQPACAEADATPIMLCAPIPSNAVVSHVDLFTRSEDSDASWDASQVSAGQETDQARFSEKKQESLADDGMKHVCHRFANWSTQHARVARMIVRYAIPAEALNPQTQVRHQGVAITPATGALAVR